MKDNKGDIRRFRASNYQDQTVVQPYISVFPLRFDNEGWNYITLNLKDLCTRVYASVYEETSRIFVHANCRIRRIFFSDQVVPENELPQELKLYTPQ